MAAGGNRGDFDVSSNRTNDADIRRAKKSFIEHFGFPRGRGNEGKAAGSDPLSQECISNSSFSHWQFLPRTRSQSQGHPAQTTSRGIGFVVGEGVADQTHQEVLDYQVDSFRLRRGFNRHANGARGFAMQKASIKPHQ